MDRTDTPRLYPQCAACPHEWRERFCRVDGGKAHVGCPTAADADLCRESLQRLQDDPELMEFARQASLQEADGYAGRHLGYEGLSPAKPRVVEIVEFARRMGYKRLGLTFCGGLRFEAATVHRLFIGAGFEVCSVMCKAGKVPKSELGIDQSGHVDLNADEETMCNPVLQALAANRHGAELNVLLGLCVGHDSLFIKHAEAPVTVLAVKDRLLGHDPLKAVYQMEHYYRWIKNC